MTSGGTKSLVEIVVRGFLVEEEEALAEARFWGVEALEEDEGKGAAGIGVAGGGMIVWEEIIGEIGEMEETGEIGDGGKRAWGFREVAEGKLSVVGDEEFGGGRPKKA